MVASKKAPASSYPNRIKELRSIRAGDLVPNPKNWRQHPSSQKTAITAILEEIGYADALIARETDAGIELIDGHLRAGLDPDAVVPVLIVDLTDAEADLMLATFDPIAGMAETNKDLLGNLTLVSHANKDIMTLLETISVGAGIKIPSFDPVGINEQPKLDEKSKTICPECGHEFTT